MFKFGFLNPCSCCSGGLQCKHYGSQGQSSHCLPQALDQTQELESPKYLVIPTDVIFQHHLVVSLENRLVELVSQLLCCLLNLSGTKSDSQASTFVQGMFICNIKIIPCSPSLQNKEQVVHEQEVDGLVDII